MVKFENGIYLVSGKIDAKNAEQFKAELKQAFAEEKVVLDFKNVEYISSAGLRVLLLLKKECKDVSIINVTSDVYEIFTLTGFSEMMNIKKGLEELNIEGCKIIGRGGTGIVYQYSDDMIVKVYNPNTSLEVVEREREFSKRAFVKGIPTAIPFGIVKVGECYGTCFELLNAVTLAEALKQNPERFEEYMEKYVNLVKHLQTIEDDKHEFVHIKDVLLSRIQSLKPVFPKEMMDLVEEITKCMPDSNTIVHGDLHTNNIMVQNDELIIIDMADLTRGPKTYDMLCLYRDFYSVATNEQSRNDTESIVGVPADLALKIWDYLLKHIFATNDETKLAQIMGSYGLLSVVNCSAMVALMPSAVIEQSKPIIIKMFNEIVLPNIEAAKIAMKNL